MTESLLLLGRPVGMEGVVAALLQSVDTAQVVPTVEAAIHTGMQPDYLVVLQHWSDEYSPGDVRCMLEVFSMSRIIVIQGPWCASDRRTRQNWPTSLCIPIERAEERWKREKEVAAGIRQPLPWTAAMDEIFSFDHDQ